MSERTKPLFEDLGKPTIRGIRKCPKCGTLNGTRGISCKNKSCKLLFKLPKDKVVPEPEIDAVKLICSTDLQIFSVKLAESDDSIRCFVHLPIIEGIEALQDASEISVIKQSAAMCYASSCKKHTDEVGTITLNLNPCAHTQFIVNCTLEAQPLEIKKGVVKVMPLSEEMRQEIYMMLIDTQDYLVQRITKNTVVVKCSPETKHPLGILHFSVFEPAKNSKRFKIMCDCQSEVYTKPFVPKDSEMCLHFYLSICAFASDTKLLEEFKNLIQCVLKIKSPGNSTKKNTDPDADLKFLIDFFSDVAATTAKRKKIDEKNTSDIDIMNVEENSVKGVKNQKKDPVSSKPKPNIIDVTPSIDFEQWLASVTERINQTMHYQFSGSPDPLTFLVPQIFFDILQQRISAGSKKKRLPNTVVAFTRKNALPIGVFSKYTWHITNILHVKRIFDTQDVPLEVTRSFIENRDGTCIACNPLQGETAKLAENFRKTLNNLLIKPLELKTFLKVGHMTIDQKDPTPFIIEWIPDILPKTHVGELRIKFEYGHQRNGIIENRSEVQTSS